MSDQNLEQDLDKCASEGPQSTLERQLIEEYLKEKGHSLASLQKLTNEESRQLMREACSYASLKLSEVESRVRFRGAIRGPD